MMLVITKDDNRQNRVQDGEKFLDGASLRRTQSNINSGIRMPHCLRLWKGTVGQWTSCPTLWPSVLRFLNFTQSAVSSCQLGKPRILIMLYRQKVHIKPLQIFHSQDDGQNLRQRLALECGPVLGEAETVRVTHDKRLIRVLENRSLCV